MDGEQKSIVCIAIVIGVVICFMALQMRGCADSDAAFYKAECGRLREVIGEKVLDKYVEDTKGE